MEDGHASGAAKEQEPRAPSQQVQGVKPGAPSPSKSSSTSEEEGQVEVRADGKKKPSIASFSPSGQSSPRQSIVQEGLKEKPIPLTWRQNSTGHIDRAPSINWRQEVGEASNVGGGVGRRGRGYDDAIQGSSRRPLYREDRRPHHDVYNRHRESSSHYDRYDLSNRSVSIGSFEDRYRDNQQPYSPGHYDERERELREREIEWDRARDIDRERGLVRERDWEWERAREREREREANWSRSRYARQSSPSRPQMVSDEPHLRDTSGSWSGPTSPSTSWRERWSSTSGVNAWERADRQRERERLGYRQSRDGSEVGPVPYPRKYSDPRSPPPSAREERERSRSRSRGGVGAFGKSTQFTSSPTTSATRSPDLVRVAAEKASDSLNQDHPIAVEALKEGETLREDVERLPKSSSLEVIEEQEQQDDISNEMVVMETIVPSIKEEEVDLEAIPLPESTNPANDTYLEPEPSTLNFLSPPISQGRKISPKTMVIDEPSVPTEDALHEESGAPDGNLEKMELVESAMKASPADGVVPPINDTRMLSSAIDTAQETAMVSSNNVPPFEDLKSPDLVKLETVEEDSLRLTTIEDKVPIEDVEMSVASPKEADESIHITKETQMDEQQREELYDASNDVTFDSTATGEEFEQAFSPRLHLDRFINNQDLSAESALPTPRTREEQDRNRSSAILRILQQQKLNLPEVNKVFHDNKKLLATKSLKPLVSAIYGEYPRKNHMEPWIDEDDQEIQVMRHKLTRIMRARQKRLNEKVNLLRSRYKHLNKEWQRHCARLDRMNEVWDNQGNKTYFAGGVGNSNTSNSMISQGTSLGLGQGGGGGTGGGPSSTEDSTVNLLSGIGPSLTRSNRRNTQTGFAGFGDAVRSEAEFLEILASLESADMQDPNMRAARTTATEPEMILNPDAKQALLSDYDDDNGFVADPVAFYCCDFDPDYWTEEEKVTFERRYALFPKQFGKIAASLPHKTAKQCVSFYYSTKHKADYDYKSLTAARNRDRKRKSRVKPKKGRGSALMADLKGDDVEEEESLQQSPGEITFPDSNNTRKSGTTPSRARILTSSTLSGDLGLITEETEENSMDQSNARKRRMDDADSDEKKTRHGNKPKRVKSERRGRGGMSIAGTSVEEIGALHRDPDLAAAEALGALAGAVSGDSMAPGDNGLGSFSSNKKKRGAKALAMTGNIPVRIEGVEDGLKRSRQTTSSYWSVAERNEFLRSLAIWGKDWDTIASRLSTKSAAQARNYFARNTEESEFMEALGMANENASLDLEKRQELATALIQKRALMANERSQQLGIAPPTGYFVSSQMTSTIPEGLPSAARGLNINSLLNEDVPSESASSRRASLNEWFGKDDKGEDSNDDTEEEDRGQEYEAEQRAEREPSDYFGGMGRSHLRYESDYQSNATAAAATPSRHLMNQMHGRSSSILSSMPPPSAFTGSNRYQLPGQRSPMSSLHYGDSSSRSSTHSPSDEFRSAHGYKQEHRIGYDREAAGRSAWTNSAGSTPIENAPQQSRHGSWPSFYSSSHLAPPSSGHSGHSPLGRGNGSPSNLSPFDLRPSTSTGASMSSFSPAHSPYDRPHSSGHVSSIRSLSPIPPTNPAPPPRLPPINQSLFSQRRDPRDHESDH